MTASRLLKSTALVLPLALGAATAGAADLVDTIEQTRNLESFSKVVEGSGMAETLKSEGPYTVFAPSDDAFMKLPQSALDTLMQDKNQAHLQSLLAQHVVKGKEIAAKEAIGQQTKLSTLQGDDLTVDGTSQVVILVPTGLQITRLGDRVVVQREAAAVATPSVEVRPTQAPGQAGQPQQQAGQTSASEDNPEAQASEQIAREASRTEPQQQHTTEGSQGQQQAGQMRASEDNPEAQASQQIAREASRTEPQEQQTAEGSQGQQAGQTSASEDNPEAQASQQIAREASRTEPQRGHQESAGTRQAGAQAGQGMLREAQVVQPDIQADNGVIHVIDAVLVPPSVLSLLEGAAAPSRPSDQGEQQ